MYQHEMIQTLAAMVKVLGKSPSTEQKDALTEWVCDTFPESQWDWAFDACHEKGLALNYKVIVLRRKAFPK